MTPSLPSPAAESYELIKTVYVLLDDSDNQVLRGHDLTPIQYYALQWLADVDRKMLSALSRDLLCDRSNVTRLADALERKGLVTRQRDTADRRITWISLTPQGRDVYQTVRRLHDDHNRARMSALSEAEQCQLEQLLAKLRDGLHQHLHPVSAA